MQRKSLSDLKAKIFFLWQGTDPKEISRVKEMSDSVLYLEKPMTKEAFLSLEGFSIHFDSGNNYEIKTFFPYPSDVEDIQGIKFSLSRSDGIPFHKDLVS